MKKLFGNETFKKILYGILSFVLAGSLTACSMFVLLKTTILNESFLMNSLNTSEYYMDLCYEITDDMVDIGDASGLNRSFFEGFIDEVMVRKDIQQYVDNFYAGEKLTVDTGDFERALRAAIDKYEKKKGIDPATLTEDSVNYFVKEAAKIYSKNIEITYFSMIQKKAISWSFKSLLYAIVLGVVVLALVCFIFFTNKWKHRGIKYISYATGASSLFLLIVSALVLVSGVTDKVAIISRSLNDLYTAVINSFLVDMLIMGFVLLTISIVLIIIHDNLRKKVL
ncbi:MAG: hypothetical protein J1F17_05705 [Oscillospiraceae bacterium]|nr:hypothetical protein [Oscillospiraceae bacterium]